MTTTTSRSIRIFGMTIVLALALLSPLALADSGGVPTGVYSVTVTSADVPPDFPPEAANILIGTWTIELSSEGETFVTKDGEAAVEGNYTSSKSHLIMRDVSGPLACLDANGIATGIYQWSLTADELTLTPVLDRCFGRSFVLTLRPMQKL